MLEGKAMIKETDMPEKMQNQAMASASQALDLYDVSDCISISSHIKKVFTTCQIVFIFTMPLFFFCHFIYAVNIFI